MADVDAHRKLVAVLCADVVGYSRMIGEDEEGTLAALTAHMTELIEPIVAGHHGRIVKTMGDGFLAEFASPIAAANCSFEIQEGLRARNADVAEPKRLRLRIGLNLGDVMVRGGDIFGDAVNVAARLQSLAEPGCVYASAAVIDQLRGHIGFTWNDLGEKQLKNIARPVKIFRLAPAGIVRTRSPDTTRRRSRAMLLLAIGAAVVSAIVAIIAYGWSPAPSPAMKPSVAVLPFVNQSGDPADDYFSQGITGDIINALGRFSALRVMAYSAVLPYKGKEAPVEIGRALGVRYLVEGSVRRAADRVRVSARLTDAQHGTLLWSAQFEKQPQDIFDVQDAVTLRVAGTIAANLSRIEQQRALSKRPEHLDAYDLVLRGRAALLRATRSSNREARQFFERALQLDPDYAAASAGLGLAYSDMASFGWSEFPKDMFARSEQLAQKALSIDAENLEAHLILSRIHSAQMQYERALVEIDRALTLNPSDAASLAQRGATLLWMGRLEEAVAALESAFALDPNLNVNYVIGLGLAYYMSRRHDDAIRFLERQALQHPDDAFISAVLAAAYGQLGRTADAERMVQTVRRRLPVFDPRIFGSQFQNPGHHEYLIEGLRKAGLT